ncbi:MAG: imidazole glycerol phosphate synthase subunit HisH [Opitutales bacterium]|nr:imidazole glycerol phosphate synthase subunit HisH [Opitutales bacterium]
MATKKVALIDYGMGNLRSVRRALEAAGATVQIVASPEAVGEASALVFPGQGAIVDAMAQLKKTGFDSFIRDWIASDKPFMGICLGLQLLFEHSEEGDADGLGIFRGKVKRFPESADLKVPHMGWNTVSVDVNNSGKLAKDLNPEGESFYFVHSYYVDTPEREIVWSLSDYGLKFVSGIRRGKVFAVQFHPEKSQAKGIALYRNFLESF